MLVASCCQKKKKKGIKILNIYRSEEYYFKFHVNIVAQV